MNISVFGRLAGALALTFALAGCIDMTTDVELTSATTAKATVTQTMGQQIYSMVKAGGAAASDESKDDQFCTKDGEDLTENSDGSATCTILSEGDFTALKFDDSGAKPTFTPTADGQVRVAIVTKGMTGELGKDSDPQTQEMMKQMFEGHFLTIRFGGAEVTDTNMTLSDDKRSAEIKIPFLELINGSAKLPEELYAVVRP
ncbi:MAG: hypothetical protein ABI697_03430 [Devosia sp.]